MLGCAKTFPTALYIPPAPLQRGELRLRSIPRELGRTHVHDAGPRLQDPLQDLRALRHTYSLDSPRFLKNSDVASGEKQAPGEEDSEGLSVTGQYQED